MILMRPLRDITNVLCNKRLIIIMTPFFTIVNKCQLSWLNPYKIEVMITSLVEMLELPNFGQTTASKI